MARKTMAWLFPWQPPAPPGRRTCHDVLAAALLLPMGIGAMVVGIIFRHALGSRFLAYEGLSAIPAAAGIAALRFGVCEAVGIVWPALCRYDEEREREFPALLCGFPFLAFAFGCAALIGAILASEAPEQPAALQQVTGIAFMVLAIGFIGGILLFLFVPLTVAIVRALRPKRTGRGRRSRA